MKNISTSYSQQYSKKVTMLSQQKGLPYELHDKVWEDKQRVTLGYLSSIEPNQDLIDCLSKLSQDGYKIACCSNSIRKSVLTILSRLGIISFFDLQKSQ